MCLLLYNLTRAQQIAEQVFMDTYQVQLSNEFDQ